MIKTINITNLINRIFNDEIFQISIIMSNQIFIKIFKILIISIAIIKVIKILITINIITRIKLIINKTIKIVNKIKIDTQTSLFYQFRRRDYKSLLIRKSTCHQTRQILTTMSINVVFFNLDQTRRRINLTISIVLIKFNLFIKLTSRMNRLSNRSINQKMKKIIIITKMKIEITRKSRKNHDTMNTTSIS